MGGNCEPESEPHARRISLDRRVEELRDTGELDDGVEPLRDLAPFQTEDRAVEVDVLPAGEFVVEARADLDKRRDTALDVDGAQGSDT